MAAYEHAGEGEEGRHKSYDGPQHFRVPAESAEVELGEYEQNAVGVFVSGINP